MRKLIFIGGSVLTLALVLTISAFTINPNTIEPHMRTVDLNDYPSGQIVLHETEVGNQYLNPLKKSVPNSNWVETHMSKERVLSSNNVQNNVTFDFFSEMPPPSQIILDRYIEKSQNPSSQKGPLFSSFTNEMNTSLENAINVDEFLDIEKKKLDYNRQEIALGTPQDNFIASEPKGNEKDFQNKKLDTVLDTNIVTVGTTGIVGEPSADNNGNVVFMTGNWYAARSTDGGNTFLFVNPYADFPLFCCDQDVIYNEKNDTWVWYRQGVFDLSLGGSGQRNHINLGVSTDDAQTWCTLLFTATDLDTGLTDHFIDYPHVQATDDKLYITTNLFDNDPSDGDDYFVALIRFDLAEISTCDFSSPEVILSSVDTNIAAVNGATDTMYFGSHVSNVETKLYQWPDSMPGMTSSSVAIPSWAFSGYSCVIFGTDPEINPCGRTDSRILGGYLSNGILGFAWNAAGDLTFTHPYVNFLRADAASGTLLTNTPIFSPTVATIYPSFGVNDAGDIAIGFFQMGGATYPTLLIGIDDSETGVNEFDFTTVKVSSHEPGTNNQWGDYIRTKPIQPDNGQFMTTGFTMQGGTTISDVEPLYVIFGRDASLCSPPGSGDWNLTTNCTMTTSASAPANVIVPNGVVLSIPNAVTLTVPSGFSITIESGGGILLQVGGTIIVIS